MESQSEPYGEDWEAEMLLHPPEQIVRMCARELRRQREEIEALMAFRHAMGAILSPASKKG